MLPWTQARVIDGPSALTEPMIVSIAQFQLFDLDKDGRISYQEFRVALKALGFSLEKPDLFAYMTAHGVPPVNWQPPASSSKAGAAKSSQHDGGATCPPPKLQLTQASFQAIAGALVYARDPREEMLRAFRLFDADDKGVITVDDLRRVAREIGEDISEEELASMIEEFDMNGKGGVGQEEFLAIVSDD